MTTSASLVTLARSVAQALLAFADDLENSEDPLAVVPLVQGQWGRVSKSTPQREKELRQALILSEIERSGGTVDRDDWTEIAARYGYAGRGTAGFFRLDGRGLLSMDPTHAQVSITERGMERLEENRARVSKALAEAS